MSDFDTAETGQRKRRGSTPAVDLMKLDRLPPHSLEAEQGVLGCCLLAPVDSLALVREKLRGPVDFYDLRHQHLAEVLLAMDGSGKPVDIITVQQQLKDLGLLEGVGGLLYLSGLMDTVPSAANLAYYLDIMVDKATLRRLLATATNAIGRVHEHEGEVAALVSEFERDALAVNETTNAVAVITMKVAVPEALRIVRHAFDHRNQGLALGLNTGLSFLDKRLGGLEPGQVFYVCGAQSTGKTSVLLSVMRHLLGTGVPVGFLSIESRWQEIVMRMVCNMARSNWAQIRTGMITTRDKEAMTAELPRLLQMPWFINDQGGMTPLDLRMNARRLVTQHGAKIIFIDHFHRVITPGVRDERQGYKEVVQAVRWIARELKVPVVCAAQVSREAKKDAAQRGRRKPQATDVRGASEIEEDADIMGVLAKDFPETEEEGGGQRGFDPDGDSWPMNLEIVKQRNGPTGPVELTFLRPYFRYEDRHAGTGSVERGERKQAKAKGGQEEQMRMPQ